MSFETLQDLYPDLRRLRFGSLVHALLTDQSPHNLREVELLDAALRHADERGWLTSDARGRLRAGDDAVVLSILDEILIAQAFDRAGWHLQFSPPGSGKHVGELLIERDEQRIFVEVKSLLPASRTLLNQTTLARLRDLAVTIDLPACLTVEINHHPHSGINHKEVRRYLHIAAEQLLDGWSMPAAYTHTSGLYLRAIACVHADVAHLQIEEQHDEYPHQVSNAHTSWQDRLWRAIRGGYAQLPHNSEPTIIIVVDHAAPSLSIEQWFAPLYEMLRMGSHRYLSGIGRMVVHELRSHTPCLTMFHNPYGLISLKNDTFFSHDECHICLLKVEEAIG